MQINKWKKDDKRFDEYVQKLKQHGIIVHESLALTIFSLNNGLQYPGLRVTSQIVGQQNLVLVPTNLLLTAHKAKQCAQLKQIFEQNFYQQGPVWQDRILITFLLYLYSLKQLNPNDLMKQTQIWKIMVQNFSKHVDILSFWQENDLNRFIDKSVKTAAQLQRKNFQYQWTQFQAIKNQYQILSRPQFTKQNYQWVYIHTISRCFGSFMNSTYFTPFCQFFNHHCSDVSYNCVTKEQFKKQEINQPKKQQIKVNKFDQDQQISSISSGQSQDFIQQGDFNYWEVDTYKIKWGNKICYDLKHKQTKLIQNKYAQTYNKLNTTIVWKGHNLLFIGQIIEKINIIKNEYMAGRKKYNASAQQLQKACQLIENYKKQSTQFYRLMGCKSTIKKPSQVSCLQPCVQANNYQKTTLPPYKQYLYFRMQSGQLAQFKTNQQIFFCYGKISNRAMLVRYGCCIQQNKYDHVWINIKMNKQLSPYPDLLDQIQQKGLPITNKIKIRPTGFCYDLYLWKKIRLWELNRHTFIDLFYVTNIDKEIQIFTQIIVMLKQKVQQFKKYPQFNNLNDSSIGYHQYFTRVYHLEKVRILSKNIQIVAYLIQTLECINGKKEIINLDSKYKHQLKGYWRMLRKGLIFN